MRNVVSFIPVLVMLSACTDSQPESPDSQPESAGCQNLDGAIFESVEALPYGENQQGTVYHPWYVALSKSAGVDWRHDDVNEHGTYACTDNMDHASTIHATFFGLAVDASYTWDPDVLVWDGHAYARCSDTLACAREVGGR